MPMPVSVTEKRSVTADALSSRRSTDSVTRPCSVNLTALPPRLSSTWRRRPGSPEQAREGTSWCTRHSKCRRFSLAIGASSAPGLVRGHAQVERQPLQLELARLDPREVERVVHQVEQPLARVQEHLDHAALVAVELRLEQQVGHAHHAVHRGAQLVGHGGQQLGLGLRQCAGPFQLGLEPGHPALQRRGVRKRGDAAIGAAGVVGRRALGHDASRDMGAAGKRYRPPVVPNSRLRGRPPVRAFPALESGPRPAAATSQRRTPARGRGLFKTCIGMRFTRLHRNGGLSRPAPASRLPASACGGSGLGCLRLSRTHPRTEVPPCPLRPPAPARSCRSPSSSTSRTSRWACGTPGPRSRCGASSTGCSRRARCSSRWHTPTGAGSASTRRACTRTASS